MSDPPPTEPAGPLIQYWHSEEPPEEIAELMSSFRTHNPLFLHRLFSHGDAEALIAEQFSGRELNAFRACALPSSQADYLRYCACFALGGLCIDADVRCLAPLESFFPRSWRGTVFGQRDAPAPWIARLAGWPHPIGPYRTLVNGIFVFSKPRDPLMELAIEVATANIERGVGDGPAGVWRTTGPGVLTAAYFLQRLGSFDAFLAYVKDTVLEPSADLFCDVVGDPTRVDEAFAGIETMAVEDTARWFRHEGIPRSVRGVRHWSQSGGGIPR